jgi:hypothetical protein
MCAFPLNSRNLGIAKNLVVQDLIWLEDMQQQQK